MEPDFRIERYSICGHEAAIRIYPAKRETAPSIIALHGFSGSGLDFLPLRKAMGAESWNWICPDFMGHGISSSPNEVDPYSLVNALRLIDFARKCVPGSSQACMLGYSMGGRIALHYLRHGESIPTALIGASPGLADNEERKTRSLQDRKIAELLMHDGIQAFSEFWESLPLIRPQCRLPEPLRSEIAARRRKNTPSGLANSLLSVGTSSIPSLWNKLESFTQVAFVFGENDEKFRRMANRVARTNNRIQVHGIPSSGHSPHLEAPEKVASLLETVFSH